MDTSMDLEGDLLHPEIKNEGGGEAPDVEKAINDLTTSFETRMKALGDEVKAANDRADALEVRMNRPSGGQRQDEPTLEQKAFEGFVRHGREHLPPDEFKALRVADGTAGGFLAPDQFLAEIIRDIVQYSPVRAAARVGQTSAGAVIIPKRIGRLGARWVGEIEKRPKTEPAYGQIEIAVHEAACYVDVSNQLLEDAAVDIAGELSADFAEEFGRLEGEAFTVGDGVKKPLGILADPDVPSVAWKYAPPTSGNIGTPLSPEALIYLMYELPAFYRNRGAWMLNGSTIRYVRMMKDGMDRFIWQESLAEGQPPTLLGRPVIEAVDMPDVAVGASPILFGDFATAYRIYDRVGLTVLRDPYSLATEGQTRFHARRRVGGSTVLPKALRKLTLVAA